MKQLLVSTFKAKCIAALNAHSRLCSRPERGRASLNELGVAATCDTPTRHQIISFTMTPPG
jgi:hypothetical protein